MIIDTDNEGEPILDQYLGGGQAPTSVNLTGTQLAPGRRQGHLERSHHKLKVTATVKASAGAAPKATTLTLTAVATKPTTKKKPKG